MSKPKLNGKRNKAEDRLQLYYEVTNSTCTLERKRGTACTRDNRTHHLLWLCSLCNDKLLHHHLPATSRMRQKHKVLHITCPHTTPPHFWLLCPVLGGKTRLTQEKMVSISLSFTMRSGTGHCPDTDQGPVQGMGRSIPSPEPSSFLKHVNKSSFYSILHPRFQNCYQKSFYYLIP